MPDARPSSQNAPINEGVDPNLPFEIPAGYTLLEASSDDAVQDKFDWDVIQKNSNLELWLIRMPNNLSVKHLDSVSLSLSSSRPGRVGELTRKQTTYDIWSCDASHPDKVDGDMYGEEMNSITCLLPRKSKNAFYAAPKPISRHVIITAQPAHAQPAAEGGEAPVTILQNPPRHSYPPELLKHRFMPYGSLVNANSSQEENETERQHKKIHSKLKPTADVGGMGTDVPQSSEKKNKKEKKGRSGVIDTEHTARVAKTAKKRKGDEEVNELERKKVKKLKVKGT
ncbi:hypothetical protein APHAL10511_007154 [Amanita phalloides]|nr:hypothetical protein APHAL10511_007154 [Amanita phalloides]